MIDLELTDVVDRRFLVVSGLPGSGKSTISRKLAPGLDLPLIDKDEILEHLFDEKGVGDASWRRTLSRKSDALLRSKAEYSNGAILVSFWHLPGMPPDSGTPTDWLFGLSPRLVNLHCECPAALAAARFRHRRRHPGHVDGFRSDQEILASIQKLEGLMLLEAGIRVCCDTSSELDLSLLTSRISAAFAQSGARSSSNLEL
jgi:glucokinase